MNYKDAVKKGNELIDKYEKLLNLWGYQDIEVHFGLVGNENKDVLVHEIKMYFWDKDYGYDLNLYRCNKNYDTNEFIHDCEDILGFLRNASSIKRCNFKEDIPKYFHALEIEKMKVSSFLDEDYVWIEFCKNTADYRFIFRRVNVVEELSKAFYEEDDEVDSTSTIWDIIEDFETNFSNYINETLKEKGWNVKVNIDVSKLTLSKKYYNGIIVSYNILTYWQNLFVKEVENIFYEVIGYLLEPKKTIKKLRQDKYHIYSNPKESKSCFLYKQGEKIEIQYEYVETADYAGIIDNNFIPKWTINYDNMDGHEFEHFCAKVLSLNGFQHVSVTQGSGDQGVDIIAFKDGIKYGIQCKCYNSSIGNRAVQEVFAGKTFYQCHLGVVLTNSYFTSSAIELAKHDGIALWDRDKLEELVDNCRSQLL